MARKPVVRPETVLRWRRSGWYRSLGRWRGGRPRVSSEVRNLIRQMTRENFLWGAPRIHGELLMLGYTVSQATVSRYLPAPGGRPSQSWRSSLRNQASAFRQYSEARSQGFAGLHVRSHWAKLLRSTTAQMAAFGVGLARGLGRQPSAPNARRISLRSAWRELAAMHRVPRHAAVFGGLQQARSNLLPIAVAVRSPPSAARASPRPQSRANQDVAFLGGPGFEKPQALRRLVCTFIAAFARMRSIQASNDRQLARPHSRRRSLCAITGAANRTITVEEFQWKSVP